MRLDLAHGPALRKSPLRTSCSGRFDCVVDNPILGHADRKRRHLAGQPRALYPNPLPAASHDPLNPVM